jgi:very-short-patch-repair endonuclease
MLRAMKGTLGYKVRTITCEGCGATVTGHLRPGQRFCSLACYRGSAKPQRKTGREVLCAVCGVPVYIPKSRLGLPRYFCSTEHANEWQGRNKTEHVCKTCGQTFRWPPSRTKTYNITYCSLACRDADPDRREQLIAINAAQQRLRPNHVERAGYLILDTLGIYYERQHLVGGKFCVDAFVPSADLVVQFDGDYWHGNPAAFPEPDARQRRRMALDRSQDAYMAACGYAVARFWASDITKRPEDVTAQLRALLAPTAPKPAVPA